MKIEIAHQDIAARAYQLYVAEGCTDGCDVRHWLHAESELKADYQDRRAQAEVLPAVAQFKPVAAVES